MKTIVVLPAYNAAQTLEITLQALPRNIDGIILVDDASTDNTYELAVKLGLKTFRHEKNRGYGGNQKTCYTEALKAGADIVVMVHPDYQYDPRVVSVMMSIIEFDICDVVLGNRVRTRREALCGGMPLYKYAANRGLTLVENLVAGQNLGEWHSGLRAYSRKTLESISWERNSDDFVFDTQLLLQVANVGLRIGDIPVPTKYFPEASSINFKRSMTYGLTSMGLLGVYLLHRGGLKKSKLFAP